MAFETAKNYLTKLGYEDRIHVLEESTATVALAAKALGVSEGEIAKSMAFMCESPIMILCAGDYKIDNAAYKQFFKKKAKMLTAEELTTYIGHEPGGVCPFGIKENILVYLDESLKQYTKVYPACGSENSAVELTIEELEKVSNFQEWISVTKPINA